MRVGSAIAPGAVGLTGVGTFIAAPGVGAEVISSKEEEPPQSPRVSGISESQSTLGLSDVIVFADELTSENQWSECGTKGKLLA
jgi:hypothetical protein